MNDLVAPPDRRATMRLRDGRLLAWSEWYSSGDTPILFCTGAGCSGWLGFGAWSVRAEAITIPVDLWYGGADTSTVHSPDFGATLAARLPNASHTLDQQEGGSILWTRSRDILAKLKSHLV